MAWTKGCDRCCESERPQRVMSWGRGPTISFNSGAPIPIPTYDSSRSEHTDAGRDD